MGKEKKINPGALERLHQNHEKKIETANEQIKQYHSSHHNILWIDDRDDNSASSGNYADAPELEWMLSFCDFDDCKHIEQVSSFTNAVDRIVNSPQYDLVIFDINLKFIYIF